MRRQCGTSYTYTYIVYVSTTGDGDAVAHLNHHGSSPLCLYYSFDGKLVLSCLRAGDCQQQPCQRVATVDKALSLGATAKCLRLSESERTEF